MSAIDSLSEIGSSRMSFDISEAALRSVMKLRGGYPDGDDLGLRIEISGVQGVEYSYELSFEVVSDSDESDVLVRVGDIVVIVPSADAERLDGASLDVPVNPDQPGLVLKNPNRPGIGAGSDLVLGGTIEENIQEVLDYRVNPAIASHGGMAKLVSVDGSVAKIELTGGCQGCGMASVTIAAGVRRTLMDALDEITDVIDVTDHSAGENPYY